MLSSGYAIHFRGRIRYTSLTWEQFMVFMDNKNYSVEFRQFKRTHTHTRVRAPLSPLIKPSNSPLRQNGFYPRGWCLRFTFLMTHNNSSETDQWKSTNELQLPHYHRAFNLGGFFTAVLSIVPPEFSCGQITHCHWLQDPQGYLHVVGCRLPRTYSA